MAKPNDAGRIQSDLWEEGEGSGPNSAAEDEDRRNLCCSKALIALEGGGSEQEPAVEPSGKRKKLPQLGRCPPGGFGGTAEGS